MDEEQARAQWRHARHRMDEAYCAFYALPSETNYKAMVAAMVKAELGFEAVCEAQERANAAASCRA